MLVALPILIHLSLLLHQALLLLSSLLVYHLSIMQLHSGGLRYVVSNILSDVLIFDNLQDGHRLVAIDLTPQDHGILQFAEHKLTLGEYGIEQMHCIQMYDTCGG